jgi:hypothetical protein
MGRFEKIMASVVATVWAGNFLADVLLEAYEPQVAIHGLFTIVLGGIFGANALRAGRKD